jgi:hypothetical protein
MGNRGEQPRTRRQGSQLELQYVDMYYAYRYGTDNWMKNCNRTLLMTVCIRRSAKATNHTVTHACTEADTLRSTPPPLHGSSSPLVNTMLEKADRRSPGNPVVAFGDNAIRRIQRSII